LKDFEGLPVDPNWSKKDIFFEVSCVAALKYKKEEVTAAALQQRIVIKKKSEDSKNPVGVSSSSKHEILIMKEKPLKNTMIKPVLDIPKKLRSVLQA
jgi:hypothetical protein